MVLSSPPVWTPERQASARATAAKFGGTPHRDRLCLPGEGVDCIHFVMAVLTEAGIIPTITLPAYDERIGRLRDHNIIEDILLEHLNAERADAPAFGDIVICRSGRQTNHIGIMIDGMLWHSPGGGRCGPESLPDWMPRIQSFLRLKATGLSADPNELSARGILTFAPANAPE